MDLLKSLFRALTVSPRPNRSRIALHTAAVVDQVIYDVGIEALVNGSLSLDKRFRPRFTGRRRSVGNEIIATVAIGELDEAAMLRAFGAMQAIDAAALRPLRPLMPT